MALWLFWLNTAAPARTNPIAMAQEVVPETVTAQSLIDEVTQFVNTNSSGRPRAQTTTAAKKSATRTIIPRVATLFNHMVEFANKTLLAEQHEVTVEDALGHPRP